jgi:hypothetical protein
MKLVKVLKKPRYFALAVLSSLSMLALYIYSQLLGALQNFDVWIKTIPWYNAVLLFVFTVFFGVTFSFQVFTWRQPKTCSATKKLSGTGTSSIGTIGLFFVSQCPACASFSALFLPVSAIIFLTQYSWLLTLGSIGLLVLALNYLGAFKE